MAESPLAGLRLLVTAGPTWTPLDAVRHLSNFSSGATGLHLARTAAAAGAAVTLLHGPGRARPTLADRAQVRVAEFVTFEDLLQLVRDEIGDGYDAMLHTAAVADYQPVSVRSEKAPSGQKEWLIRLAPTLKIVDEVKPLDPKVFLVKFKLEVGKTVEELLQIGRQSRARSNADLLVANDLRMMTPDRHPAWILDADGVVAEVKTREELGSELIRLIGERAPLRATGVSS